MNWYESDDNKNVVECSVSEFNEWHDTISDEVKTGLGLTVASWGGDPKYVSTVFLRGYSGYQKNAPMVFEITVFSGEGKEDRRTYATWDEAVAGHQDIVSEIAKQRIER